YIRWRQSAPEHEPGEETYADGQLQIRVIDLNADQARRDEIVSQNPSWLAQESDPVSYLRGRDITSTVAKSQVFGSKLRTAFYAGVPILRV
ncbi:MAG: hypothetical protein ACLPV8_07985, partial [Steroidobacteraceae bacterium]